MPLTYEERIKLLEKARAAKAAKRAGLTQNKEQEPAPAPEQESEPAPVEKPKKSRSKPVKPRQAPEGRTLELPPEPAPMSDEEPEIEERIVYRPKTQKKKKIIRTIIKDASDDDDEEEVHETIEVPPKNKISRANKPAVELPKICPSKTNFFCY
jgi:hypothetical protein